MSDNSEGLLRAILSVCGRQAFKPEELSKIVGGGPKQNEAFNLCDGTRGQGEIANALKLDAGNFSRTVARWVEEGVLFRLSEGREAKLLHVYPLSSKSAAQTKKGAGK